MLDPKGHVWINREFVHTTNWPGEQLTLDGVIDLKRRFWDKCCVCGKRGFKGSAMSDWDGTKIWHSECDINNAKPGNNP